MRQSAYLVVLSGHALHSEGWMQIVGVGTVSADRNGNGLNTAADASVTLRETGRSQCSDGWRAQAAADAPGDGSFLRGRSGVMVIMMMMMIAAAAFWFSRRCWVS